MEDDHGIVPSGITTPNSVDSKVGRLLFTDGYPTAESVLKIGDELPILADDEGGPLKGTDTYEVTVPAGIVRDDGYFSVTVYDGDTSC